MNYWENMKPVSGTIELTGDFLDWLKELRKTSITELDVIGLHDNTTGEKREFVAIEKVFEIVDAAIKHRNERFRVNHGLVGGEVLKEKILELKKKKGGGDEQE